MTEHSKVMKVPAYGLACAWLSVWKATGEEEALPRLYRSVLIEEHDGFIAVLSTNGIAVLGATVSFDGDEPPRLVDVMGSAPSRRWVVMDVDKRVGAMLGFVRRQLRKPENDDGETISLYEGVVDEDGAMFPRDGLVFATDTERVVAPLYDGVPIDWRPVLASHKPKATKVVTFNPDILAAVTALPGAVQFSLGGEVGFTAVSARPTDDRLEPVWGGIMPLQVTS